MAAGSGSVLAGPADSLLASLSDAEKALTVEEFLKSAAQKRAIELKRHGEDLIQRYDAGFKRARKVLRDVANEQVRAAADESNASDTTAAALPLSAAEPAAGPDQQCDAFALVAIRGTHKGRSFKIEPTADKKVWTVGRTSDNDLCLSGDDEVSSAHAKVMFERKQFKLQDLSSTNGTYATNGAGSTCKLKPRKNHVLKLDHLVSFGGSTFKWCYYADALDVAAQAAKMTQAKASHK